VQIDNNCLGFLFQEEEEEEASERTINKSGTKSNNPFEINKKNSTHLWCAQAQLQGKDPTNDANRKGLPDWVKR
jgi:hypothetical protein